MVILVVWVLKVDHSCCNFFPHWEMHCCVTHVITWYIAGVAPIKRGKCNNMKGKMDTVFLYSQNEEGQGDTLLDPAKWLLRKRWRQMWTQIKYENSHEHNTPGQISSLFLPLLCVKVLQLAFDSSLCVHENVSQPPQCLSIFILLTPSCLFTHYRQMHPANNVRVLSHPRRVLSSQRHFIHQLLAVYKMKRLGHKWVHIKEENDLKFVVDFFFLVFPGQRRCKFIPYTFLFIFLSLFLSHCF